MKRLFFLILTCSLVLALPLATHAADATCADIGANFANFYPTGNYTRAKKQNMGWTLQIASRNNLQATIEGINKALSLNMKPIVRIGVGSDDTGFGNPHDYAEFLKQVAAGVSGEFYAIAGPNEPDGEDWVWKGVCPKLPENPASDPGQVAARCVGRQTALYTEQVLGSIGTNSKIKLLSPAFNITSWSFAPIIDEFKRYSNWKRLDAMSGNVYNLNGVTMTDWLDVNRQVSAVSEGKPWVLTEAGDFDRDWDRLSKQLDELKNKNYILGILLFNPFGDNPDPAFVKFVIKGADWEKVLGTCGSADSEVQDPYQAGFTPFKYACRDTVPKDLLDKTREFHPLRPYPGSPCDPLIPIQENIAFQCGKSLNAEADIELPNDGSRCKDDPSQVCLDKEINFKITLDLSNVQVPVLGNTQNLGLSDAEKVNNYLSWYLNGTTQQSEQKPVEDINRVVNYSGPLKILLPFDSQSAIRSQMITGPVEQQYHNYMIGCQRNVFNSDYQASVRQSVNKHFSTRAVSDYIRGQAILDSLDFWLELIFDNARRSEFFEAAEKHNLGKLAQILHGHPDLFTAFSKAGEIETVSFLALLNNIGLDHAIACDNAAYFDFKHLKDQVLPPKPSDYGNFSKYWEAYLDWAGRLNLPFNFGSIDVPWKSNLWAELFQNVPLATLEDTVGEITVGITPDNQIVEVSEPAFKNGKLPTLTIRNTDGRLYMPHLRNIRALSNILTNITRPREGQYYFSPTNDNDKKLLAGKIEKHQGDGGVPVVESATKNTELIPNQKAPKPPEQVSYDNLCELSNFRSEPTGDSTVTNGKTITADLKYTHRFRYSPVTLTGLPANAKCEKDEQCQSGECREKVDAQGTRVKTCNYPQNQIKKPTEGKVMVFTKTPIINDIYNSLVAEKNAFVRRFLAKESADLLKTEDKQAVPAASEITYSAQYIGGTDGTSKGATAGLKSGPAQIYFAKIGSLFDYVLGASSDTLNIQKMLRPKDLAPGQEAAKQCTVFSETAVTSAIQKAATKYEVSDSLLQAVSEIEAFPYLSNPSSYVCKENSFQAAGVMQITRPTYEIVTCPSERYSDDLPICNSQDPKMLSRCDIDDNLELAARTLLWKAGRWLYGANNCNKTRGIAPTEKMVIYRAVNNYYGSCNPDNYTKVFRGGPPVPRGREKNYGDIVLIKMGLIRTTSDYPVPQCP